MSTFLPIELLNVLVSQDIVIVSFLGFCDPRYLEKYNIAAKNNLQTI
jgi:hypothetical protein